MQQFWEFSRLPVKVALAMILPLGAAATASELLQTHPQLGQEPKPTPPVTKYVTCIQGKFPDQTLILERDSTTHIELQPQNGTEPQPAIVIYIHQVGAINMQTEDGRDIQEMTIDQLAVEDKTFAEPHPPSAFHFSAENDHVVLDVTC